MTETGNQPPEVVVDLTDVPEEGELDDKSDGELSDISEPDLEEGELGVVCEDLSPDSLEEGEVSSSSPTRGNVGPIDELPRPPQARCRGGQRQQNKRHLHYRDQQQQPPYYGRNKRPGHTRDKYNNYRRRRPRTDQRRQPDVKMASSGGRSRRDWTPEAGEGPSSPPPEDRVPPPAAVPPRAIPLSPLSLSEEEEDIDEDLLYLRLIALRSMQQEDEAKKRLAEAGGAEEERPSNGESMIVEMQRLLAEADEARISGLGSTGGEEETSQDSAGSASQGPGLSYTPTQSPTLPISTGNSPTPLDQTGKISPAASPDGSPDHIPLPPPPPLPQPPSEPEKTPPPPPPLAPSVVDGDEPLPPGDEAAAAVVVLSRCTSPPRPESPAGGAQDMDLVDSENEAETRFFSDQHKQWMMASVEQQQQPPPPPHQQLMGGACLPLPPEQSSWDNNSSSFQVTDYSSYDYKYYAYNSSSSIGGQEAAGPCAEKRAAAGRERRRKTSTRRKRKSSSGTKGKENLAKRQKQPDKLEVAEDKKTDAAADEEENEEDALRQLLLKQVNKNKTDKNKALEGEQSKVSVPQQEKTAQVATSIAQNETNLHKNKNTMQKKAKVELSKEQEGKKMQPMIKKTSRIESTKISVKETKLKQIVSAKSAGPKSKLAETPPAVVPKSAVKLSAKSIVKIVEKKVSKSVGVFRKKLPTQTATSSVSKLSPADVQKHFPNLSKSVVIFLDKDDDSSSDEGASQESNNRVAKSKVAKKASARVKSNSSSKNGAGSSGTFDFGKTLDAFLKQARHRSSSKAPTGRLQKKLEDFRSKQLTPQAKHNLMSSSISHLAIEKQKEYTKLKQIIEKKEKAKKAQLAKKKRGEQQSVTTNKQDEAARQVKDENLGKRPEVPSNSQTKVKISSECEGSTKGSAAAAQGGNEDTASAANDDVDETELMRQQLLLSMRGVRKSEKEKKQQTADVKAVECEVSEEVVITREVKVNKRRSVDTEKVCHKSEETKQKFAVSKKVQGTGSAGEHKKVEIPQSTKLKGFSSMTINISEHKRDVRLNKKSLDKPAIANKPKVVDQKSKVNNKKPSVSNSKANVVDKVPGGSVNKPKVVNSKLKKLKNQKQSNTKRKEDASKDPVVQQASEKAQQKSHPGTNSLSSQQKDEARQKKVQQSEKGSQVGAKQRQEVSPENLKLLQSAEDGVAGGSRGLLGSLYKLSAYMSQLSKDMEDLRTTQELAVKLRQELTRVDELARTKQAKVDSLRSVIKSSHQEVMGCNEELNTKKSKCLELGVKLHGPGYSLPAAGDTDGESIHRKLAQIQATAEIVKSSNSGVADGKEQNNSQPEGAPASKEVGEAEATGAEEKTEASGDPRLKQLQQPPPPKLPAQEQPTAAAAGVYASSLEHLRQEAAGEDSQPVVDPNAILCRFELNGRCNDPKCPYQHYGK